MPISRRQFDDELAPQDEAILDFLDKNPSQAFSLNDIFQLTSDNLLVRMLEVLANSSRMDNLVSRGLVESKIVNGHTYYASRRRS